MVDRSLDLMHFVVDPLVNKQDMMTLVCGRRFLMREQ